MNITTIFYIMLEVLHCRRYRTTKAINHATMNDTVATEAIADYYVGVENNIVDDVINQFS